MHLGIHQMPVPDFIEQIGKKSIQMSQGINCQTMRKNIKGNVVW